METDSLYERLLNQIEARLSPTPVELPAELAQPRSKLRLLTARHHNWTAEGFRKLFSMRFSMRVPPLQQMNIILYPDAESAQPIFIFFCLRTRRKVIAHLNYVCPPADDL